MTRIYELYRLDNPDRVNAECSATTPESALRMFAGLRPGCLIGPIILTIIDITGAYGVRAKA